jgi:acetyltransferase
MSEIAQINATDLEAVLPELAELLHDAVESGASLGFLPPLKLGEADNYWQGLQSSLADGSRVLLVARAAGQIVGTVQLELSTKANGLHRAEVQKLMVHRVARGQGLGRELMQAIEAQALQFERSLLILDTRQGDPAEALYRSLGYEYVGTIPAYARNADGELHATALFYKQL